jgi:hypothetical protein
LRGAPSDAVAPGKSKKRRLAAGGAPQADVTDAEAEPPASDTAEEV